MTQVLSTLAIQPEELPNQSASTAFHVAIIMDGNGRWAQRRGLPRRVGHYYGVEAARRVVRSAAGTGITHLTLFGFSTENWNRPWPEVQYLLNLLRSYLQNDVQQLHENGVCLKIVGDLSSFPSDIVALIAGAHELTKGNAGIILTIALGFGGRADIVAAARYLASSAVAGDIKASDIDDTAFAHALPSAFLPDVDLLIRTSGEQRVSNFLLWQLAYTELLFVDRCWPEFTQDDLVGTLANFRQRHRRYGGV